MNPERTLQRVHKALGRPAEFYITLRVDVKKRRLQVLGASRDLGDGNEDDSAPLGFPHQHLTITESDKPDYFG